MAAVVDLDLNRPPRSPEPAAPEDLKRAMLRQEHTFRDQVKDLHRLYWAQRNLTDGSFWTQSGGAIYTQHESLMMDFDEKENPYAFIDSNEIGKKSHDEVNEVVEENSDVKSSVWKKPDASAWGRYGRRNVIDLEKPATLDDEVETGCSSGASDLASHKTGRFWDGLHCCSRENCLPAAQVLSCTAHNACHVSSGSIGSSDTPDSTSPVKPKNTASGHMVIDLNIAQEDDHHVSSDPSQMCCSPLIASYVEHPRDLRNNSSKIFEKECESGIGSSKGSSITVFASARAPDSSTEVIASGLFHDSRICQPFSVHASEHSTCLRGNTRHQHTVNKVCRLSSQGCVEIPRKRFPATSYDGNSSLYLPKLGDNHVASKMGKPASAVDCGLQEGSFTILPDDKGEGIDLNISVGSTDLPSTVVNNSIEKEANNDGSKETVCSHSLANNGSQQTNHSVKCPVVRDQHTADNKDGKEVLLPVLTNNEIDKVVYPDSGIAINRPVLIQQPPQGHKYVCPRLRASNCEASDLQDAVSTRQTEAEEDEKIVTMAAETLLSIFKDNSACIADSLGSNSQPEAQDRSDEPQLSLDSFEEGVLNLEEIRDDGESISVRPPDEDGPSCGIKLKRGRGLRDFQREILPGLVSLARHEICDDLHAIGYELRKTRSRRTCGDQWPPSARTRPPRRCSTAWNR